MRDYINEINKEVVKNFVEQELSQFFRKSKYVVKKTSDRWVVIFKVGFNSFVTVHLKNFDGCSLELNVKTMVTKKWRKFLCAKFGQEYFEDLQCMLIAELAQNQQKERSLLREELALYKSYVSIEDVK